MDEPEYTETNSSGLGEVIAHAVPEPEGNSILIGSGAANEESIKR
jgi:hypothetical protein